MEGPEPRPAERYAPAEDGARIGYDRDGAGEAMVLLAGRANSRSWWRPVRSDFAQYLTIALDHAGTGLSEEPVDGEWSTRRFARDVVAVLDHAGVARAHVYGTSMGGRVAQWLAVDHPDRMGALVLGCTSGGGAGAVPPDPEVLEALEGTMARDELVDLMVGPDWRGAHSEPSSVLGDPTMSSAARRGHRRASARHDTWNALPRVAVPTLVLHGTADRLTPPANGERLAERIPCAELRFLPGARHAYFLEHRSDASAAVLDFLLAHPIR